MTWSQFIAAIIVLLISFFAMAYGTSQLAAEHAEPFRIWAFSGALLLIGFGMGSIVKMFHQEFRRKKK